MVIKNVGDIISTSCSTERMHTVKLNVQKPCKLNNGCKRLVQTCIFETIRATGKLRPVLSTGHQEYRRPVEGKRCTHRINNLALVQDRCKTLEIYKVHGDLIICINSHTNSITQSLCNFLVSRKNATCTVFVHGTVM